MLESREALISATGFALDHVIEQAKLELGTLYGQHLHLLRVEAAMYSNNNSRR